MADSKDFLPFNRDSFITSFGVGCFHFALRERREDTLEHATYFQLITSSLSNLSAVEDLIVHTNPLGKAAKWQVPEVLPDISHDPGCFPQLGPGSMVHFTLFLPQRIQADFFKKVTGVSFDTLTEHFRVHVMGTWSGLPIAFVEPDKPTDIPQASESVIIVREFLVRQFEINKSPLTLQVLGPTPVHADFYVFDTGKKQEGTKSDFTSIYVPRPAYAAIFIGVNKADYQDSSEIMEAIISEVIDETVFFYEMTQNSNHQLLKWSHIAHMFDSLADLLRQPGMKGVMLRFVRLSGLIKEITISLTEFQAMNIQESERVRQSYDRRYAPATEFRPLKPLIDAEINRVVARPIRDFADTVKFAEARRTMSFQLLVNIIVGLLGGIAGAVTTLIFQK